MCKVKIKPVVKITRAYYCEKCGESNSWSSTRFLMWDIEREKAICEKHGIKCVKIEYEYYSYEEKSESYLKLEEMMAMSEIEKAKVI